MNSTMCDTVAIWQDLQFTGHGFKSWLGTIAWWSWASYLHLCASVTKQYNLVPAKGMISLAEKVTAGLVETNGSLPPGL